MKILHVNKFFDLHGGAEVYMHRLIEHQRTSGDLVHAFSTRGDKDIASDDRKYFVFRYDYSRSEGLKKDAVKAMNYIWNREAERSMRRMLTDVRPDIIHLHNIYHHLSSSILKPIRESGIPCVQTLHDLKLIDPNYNMFVRGQVYEGCRGGKYWNTIIHRTVAPTLMPNLLAAAEMFFTKMTQVYEKTVRRFLCPSEFWLQKMIEYGEPAPQFEVLRLPSEFPEEAASGGGGYVLFVGRLDEGKGLGVLIRAIAECPELPLRIAGTGPEEDRFKHLARMVGATNVTFLGFIPPKELSSLRRNAEAVIVPSVYYENSPLTILEAMADGIPVIASRIGGIPELIDDEVEGLLANPGDVADWTRALERFRMLNADGRRRMGERGRERIIRNHRWEDHLRALRRIYVSVGAKHD